MPGHQKLRAASLLYRHAFPLYRKLYFSYKKQKDKRHLELLSRLVKPGSTVLDIGSNIGFFTGFFASHVGSRGHVYSFEPDHTNFRHLADELRGVSNVTLLQKAVASSTGTATLYESALLNVDHRTYEPAEYAGKYSIEQVSIDEFVAGKFNVDFIKLDIQGSEMEALRGMDRTLDANPEIRLLMELWPYGLQQAGSSAVEVFDYLSRKGFRFYNTAQQIPAIMSREEANELKVGYYSDANVLLSRTDIF